MSIFDSIISTINSVFGTTATYSYLDGSPDSTINGVLDIAFVESNDVASRKLIFKNVVLSSLSAEPTEDDTLTIGSDVYLVKGHEPDSYGTTILILEKT